MCLIYRSLLFFLLVLSPPAMAQVRASIDVGQLSQIEQFSISALTPDQSALPNDQWLNSSGPVLHDLLVELPVSGGSPVINDLLGRMLLSGGIAPVKDTVELTELARLRLAALYALGHLNAVTKIAARSPDGHSNPDTVAITVNALLALNKTETACSMAEQLNQARSAAFWLQMRAFCLAKAGNIARAELTAELALNADPGTGGFLRSINRITSPAENIEVISPETALGLAMIRAANDQVATQNLTLALQAGLGEQEEPPLLDLLYQAYLAGAVSVGEISDRLLDYAASLEKKQPPSILPATEAEEETTEFEQELAQLKRHNSLIGIDRLASLLALARNAKDAAIRAEAMTLIVDPKLSWEHWLGANRLIAGEIRYLPVVTELKQYAPALVRASLLSGNVSLGKKWLALIDSDDNKALNFIAVFHAMKSGAPLKAEYLQARKEGTIKEQQLLVSDLLAISALGNKVSADMRHWLSLRSELNYANCQPAKLMALRSAASSKAIAETILRVADLIREDGFDTLSDLCSAEIIWALTAVGLQSEAKKAAMEWMFARRQMP